ncbi:MAG: YggT family protein [Spirochaetales bacterium]|nr:YggT family protein [Spirochaetales bacterium]
MLKALFGIIALSLSVYSFIIFVRILFSWFNLKNINNGFTQSKIVSFLYSITDPYLDWFKRFKFSQIGMIDFSPLLGIGVLYFFSNLFAQIATTGVLSISFIIKLVISTVWSLISSVIFIFIILLAIRIIFIQLNKYSQFFYAIDGYLESIARRFSNLFTKKFTSYKINLLILVSGLIICRFGIQFLINLLFKLF